MAGVAGIPFPDGTLNVEPCVVYGHVGAGLGVHGSPLIPSNNCSSVPRPLVVSGDSTAPVMEEARNLALAQAPNGGGSNVLYG
jgi:hypothetical protein